LAKQGESRPALDEQLADHSGDATEKMRSETIFKTRHGWSFSPYPGREALRVHRADVRMPYQVDLCLGEFGHVGLPGSRVRSEIFMRRELGRVDENRNDNLRRAPLCLTHQRQMPFVKRAHGRHQGNGCSPSPQALQGAAQRGKRADNGGGGWHCCSVIDLRARLELRRKADLIRLDPASPFRRSRISSDLAAMVGDASYDPRFPARLLALHVMSI
jgi:hypothetical protein